VTKSGTAESADGIPARKEWPSIRQSGICLHNKREITSLKCFFDRYSVSEKAKPGRVAWLSVVFAMQAEPLPGSSCALQI
jgi:hypothetical protein